MGYKLRYFNVRYLGEPSRMMFYAAGEKFEDTAFNMDEWKTKFSKVAPLGKAPWLEVDGQVIAESWAINRFLAKRFGFNGKDEFEEARIDTVAHFFRSQQHGIFEAILVAGGLAEGDEDKVYREKTKPALEAMFTLVDKCFQESGSGFILKSGVSWIDLVFAENVIMFEHMLSSFKDDFPEILEYKERVLNHPKFKKFADNRRKYKVGYIDRISK